MQLLNYFLALAIAAPVSSMFVDAEQGISTSWAGVNSYFLHALKSYDSFTLNLCYLLIMLRPDRLAVLDAIKNAQLKTLRIFISHTYQNNKNTGSIEMPDIEPLQVGTYDDTQLRAIDQLMVEAHARGRSS